MKNFFYSLTSPFHSLTPPIVKTLQNLGFAKKTADVLSDGFDISMATEIGEADLKNIFSNRFIPNTKPFFIISNPDTTTPKRKFDASHIDKCYGSAWFAYIQPNRGSHTCVPSLKKWVRVNSKKDFLVGRSDGKVWGHGGGTFQLDKNLGQWVIHTNISIESMGATLSQALS